MIKKRFRFISILISVCLIFLMSFVSKVNASDKVDPSTLKDEMNTFISKIKSNGTYDEIYDYWFDINIENKKIDKPTLTGENGHLVMGTTTQEPFSYVNNNERIGFTIDLVYHFCEEYDYTIDFEDYNTSSGLITALQSGKCDFAGGNTSITEERKKQVNFSDSFFDNRVVIIVNKEDIDKFKDESDFIGYSIGTITGGSITGRIKNVSNDIDVKEYNSVADACKALDNKLIDGVSYDEMVLALAMKNYSNQVVAAYLGEPDQFGFLFAKEEDSSVGIFTSLYNSFYRNFIEGDRYKLLLEGLLTTVLITILSILFGTLLGFVVYMNTGKNNKLVNAISFIIDGLPAVVLLMILYYVVFGKLNIGGVFVSVVAFSLIFASSVLSLLRTSVGAIDKGQFEVSYALGYDKKEAFYKMILPQALTIAWPGYKGAIISLIKGTAIVGYIAEVDLTKAGDMVRSSTFEAFFPLIVVAIIYFILAWLLTQIVNIISKAIGPSELKSKNFLKGVKR